MRPLRSGCLHAANEYTRTAPSQGKTGRSRWRCCSIFPGSRCSDLRAHFIQRRHAIFFYISSRALIYILNYLLFIASYSSSIKLERQVIFITTGFLLFQPLFVCLLRRVLINSPPPSWEAENEIVKQQWRLLYTSDGSHRPSPSSTTTSCVFRFRYTHILTEHCLFLIWIIFVFWIFCFGLKTTTFCFVAICVCVYGWDDVFSPLPPPVATCRGVYTFCINFGESLWWIEKKILKKKTSAKWKLGIRQTQNLRVNASRHLPSPLFRLKYERKVGRKKQKNRQVGGDVMMMAFFFIITIFFFFCLFLFSSSPTPEDNHLFR